MKTVLLDLFTSKKFLAALTAVAVYLAGRFGFNLDAAALDRIYAAFLVYVGAQGAADFGKSAAIVAAVAPASDNAAPVVRAKAPEAGFARLAVMLTIDALLLTPLIVVACITNPKAKAVESAAGRVALDCTAAERAELVAAVVPTAVSAIKLAEHPDGTLDDAAIKQLFSGANLKTEAGTIVTCAAAEAYKAILAALTPSAPGIAARTAPNATADALQAAFAELRAEQFPGVAIVTSTGEI